MARNRNLRNSAAALMVLACASGASAQATKPIRFAPGATAAEVKGVIKGRGDATYTLEAAQGQVMQVLFAPSNRACSFNAFAPRSDIAAHDGSVSGNEFGASPAIGGRYRFQVYLMRSAARRNEICRYRLSVEVTGRPGGASAGVSDVQMRDACLAKAAPMYGVTGARIRLQAMKKGPDGPFIDGVVNKGSEGLKKMRCRFTPERTLRDVMAMTPDGE